MLTELTRNRYFFLNKFNKERQTSKPFPLKNSYYASGYFFTSFVTSFF